MTSDSFKQVCGELAERWGKTKGFSELPREERQRIALLYLMEDEEPSLYQRICEAYEDAVCYYSTLKLKEKLNKVGV